MNLVYYISAISADVEYDGKRSALRRLSTSQKVEFFFPLERRRSFVVKTALHDIRTCQLVIADLSLERPSCYFEVGLAQAAGTPVVLIATAGTRFHQAGGTERVITYTNLSSYESAIKLALSQVIDVHAEVLHQADLVRLAKLGQDAVV